MTEEYAIEIAKQFAIKNKKPIGQLCNVITPDAIGQKSLWTIVFNRLNSEYINPNIVVVKVHDVTGNTFFETDLL